jgi:hypothetical protein
MSDVIRILSAIEQGDLHAAEAIRCLDFGIDYRAGASGKRCTPFAQRLAQKSQKGLGGDTPQGTIEKRTDLRTPSTPILPAWIFLSRNIPARHIILYGPIGNQCG